MTLSFHKDHSIQVRTFDSLVQELKQTVHLENVAVLPYVQHINALLQRAVTVCRVAANSTPVPKLPVNEVIPPGKTIDHQWRFKQTAKSPGRKKNGQTFRLAFMLACLA